MNTIFKKSLKYFLFIVGYKVQKIPGRRGRLPDITSIYNINVIFDVGANQGQYAKEIRDDGYKGQIISFEPQHSVHSILLHNSKFDENWSVHPPVALGSSQVCRDMYISDNSVSSSLLEITKIHTAAEKSSEVIATETVQITMLDDLYQHYINDASIIMLKLDVQGYELEVLRGSLALLTRCTLIKLELSTKILYTGQPLYYQIDEFLRGMNYSLIDLVPGFRNECGIMLQYDAVYARNF